MFFTWIRSPFQSDSDCNMKEQSIVYSNLVVIYSYTILPLDAFILGKEKSSGHISIYCGREKKHKEGIFAWKSQRYDGCSDRCYWWGWKKVGWWGHHWYHVNVLECGPRVFGTHYHVGNLLPAKAPRISPKGQGNRLFNYRRPRDSNMHINNLILENVSLSYPV